MLPTVTLDDEVRLELLADYIIDEQELKWDLSVKNKAIYPLHVIHLKP